MKKRTVQEKQEIIEAVANCANRKERDAYLKSQNLTYSGFRQMRDKFKKDPGARLMKKIREYRATIEPETVSNPGKVRQTRLRMLIEMLLEELDTLGL